MAINDIYTTYECKKCASEVEEIPLQDHWDEQVLSRFKCLGCGLDIYDYDDNFDDCIKTIHHKSLNSVMEVVKSTNLRTMKIIDFKMYGTEKKTFILNIENYDINASDKELKHEIIFRIYKVISALGFNKGTIDISNDVEFYKSLRCDNERFILSTVNIDNLV